MLAVAEVVAVFNMFAEAALGPAFGALHGFDIIFVSVGEGSELVEGHVDVGADLALDLHGFFGADEIGLTGEGIEEIDAVFGDFCEAVFVGGVGNVAFFFHRDDFAEAGAEGHDLEAARVGEGWGKPGSLKVAVLRHRLCSRRVHDARRYGVVALNLVVSPDPLAKRRRSTAILCSSWLVHDPRLDSAFLCGDPVGEAAAGGDGGGLVAEVVAVGEHGLGAEFVEVSCGDEADVAVRADGHEGGGLDVAVGGMDDAGAAELAGDGFLDFELHNIYYSMF